MENSNSYETFLVMKFRLSYERLYYSANFSNILWMFFIGSFQMGCCDKIKKYPFIVIQIVCNISRKSVLILFQLDMKILHIQINTFQNYSFISVLNKWMLRTKQHLMKVSINMRESNEWAVANEIENFLH